VVLSADPAATSAAHGVETWSRSPGAVWKALDGARLLISGGGSLVQDVTSARSAVYYLGLMVAASMRGVPVAVVGQGVGPLRRWWVRTLARHAFGRAAVLSVRDADSAALLAGLGVAAPVHVGADLAVLAPAPSPSRGEDLLAGAGLHGRTPRLAVAARPWPGLADPRDLGAAIRRFAAARGVAVCVLVFDRMRDVAVSRALAGATGGTIIHTASVPDLVGVIGAMDLMLGVRLHSLILAAAQGVPVVGLAYDPKVASFMRACGSSGLLRIDARPEAVEGALAEAWEARISLRARLLARLPAWRQAAAESVEAAMRLV
jgi:polysaccharide pyruvyl transferase CsaB